MAAPSIPARDAIDKHPVWHAQEILDGKRGIRILCIDGGGTRGVISCQFIKALEEHLGCKLYEYFDLICGTSTGGLLAFAISALRLSADECDKLYCDFSNSIFASGIKKYASLVSRKTFGDTPALEKLLDDVVGSSSLDDIPYPHTFCISSDGTTQGVAPYLFRTYDLDLVNNPGAPKGTRWATLKTALRATSAAPVYLAPLNWKGMVLQDGGLCTNNPTQVAVIEAGMIWPTTKIDVVVSLGTGTEAKKSAPNSSPIIDAYTKAMNSATDTEDVHRLVTAMLRDAVYVRLQTLLYEKCDLDEVDPKKLAQLRELAKETIKENRNAINRIPKPGV